MSDTVKFPNIARLNPRSCISAKVRKCQRIVSEVFRKRLLPFDITSSQLSILFIVAKAEGVTQQQISDWLVLEKSTVSRNMKRLFERKLIQKDPQQILSMTYSGNILLEQVIPAWEAAMEEIRIRLQPEGEQALDIVMMQLLK